MLSGQEIQDELDSGKLVITPRPLAPLRGVAVDLTLHNVFWESTLPSIEGVHVMVEGWIDSYEFLEERIHTEFRLQPRSLIIGETAEAISLPLDICGWIEGKSGRARLGLGVHLTAPKIDPGWGFANPKRITLEIVNHFNVPILLRPGMGIAQLLFHRLNKPSDQYEGLHRDRGT